MYCNAGVSVYVLSYRLLTKMAYSNIDFPKTFSFLWIFDTKCSNINVVSLC